MKKVGSTQKLIIFSTAALILGFALGAIVFRGGAGKSDDGAASAAKEEIWTCSMHPQVRAPKPGLCPICAMDLIPLSSMGAAGGAREFSMSEEAKKLAGITTVSVERRFPEAEIRLFGKVAYDQSRLATVAARFDGRIDRLFIDFTGVQVKQGDHLALIYSPELLTAQSELLTAKKFNNQDATRLARDKLRLWGFSKEKILEIESTGKVADQLEINAPTSGIVTHLNVKEGDYVKTGTRFFQIADISHVWVMLEAYESDLPWIRYGQTVEFFVESFPSQTFEGTISFISPELDSRTRTTPVRVTVPNPGEVLKPGMFARAVARANVSAAGKVIDPSLAGKWISPMHPEIVKDGPGKCDICGMALVPAENLGYSQVKTGGDSAPLLVPRGAVLHTGKRSVVYVEKPGAREPTFEGRDVLLGPKTGDFYIIEAGLNEGEKVVAEGGFVIDSALQIQAKSSMMLPGEAKPLYRKIPVPDSFLAGTDLVLQSYFDVQSGLAADAFEKAKEATVAGANRVSKVQLDELPEDAVEVWTPLAKKLADSFHAIMHAKDINTARAEFKNLTFVTDEMVRRFGTAFLPVHEMHCPMAFNDTGASWFQPDKDLLNPYFGSGMLRCGTVEETLAPGKAFPVPDGTSSEIGAIVKSYFEIAEGLSWDNNDRVRRHVAEMKKLVGAFDKSKLSHPLAPGMWFSLSGALDEQLSRMETQASIDLNRVYFEKLSGAMKGVVLQFGGGLPFAVNEAHCPMAFNEEGGNWLLDSKEIRNPYFGSKMLKCGEIVETIHTPAQ